MPKIEKPTQEQEARKPDEFETTPDAFIEKMQRDLDDIEEGDQPFESVNYKNENESIPKDINQQRFDIKKRARKLFNKTRRTILMVMATMTFSSAMDADGLKPETTEIPKTNKQTESQYLEQTLINIDRLIQETKSEKERLALIDYKNSIKKVIELEEEESLWLAQQELEKNPQYRAGKIKEKIIARVRSKEYLERLTIEFGGDIKKARETQKERLNNLRTVKFNFADSNDIESKWAAPDFVPNGIDEHLPKWYIEKEKEDIGVDNIAGFYSPSNHDITLPSDYVKDILNEHEDLHGVTRGSKGIPESTKKKLAVSYKKLGTKEDKYFSSPTERLTRKQRLDFEMEELGIKNYGEEFTERHLKQLNDLYKKGQLSPEARDFLKTTRPEDLKNIFNEIAGDEPGGNRNEAIS